MSAWDTCRVCPRLCRDGCPVATGSAREAAVPSWIATAVHAWSVGGPAEDARQAATLCTDCGACRDHCHLHRPLPELLRAARAELVAEPPMEPLGAVEGAATTVVVVTDARPLAAWVGSTLDAPVAVLRTGDALGVAAIEHPGFQAQAERLRQLLSGRDVVVAHGGVARALTAAGVSFRWAFALVAGLEGVHSCATGGPRPLACCGGAGPLVAHHPDDAARVARRFAERGEVTVVLDACCRDHLRSAGVAATDWLDGEAT